MADSIGLSKQREFILPNKLSFESSWQQLIHPIFKIPVYFSINLSDYLRNNKSNMAGLRDHLNRTVLYVDFEKQDAEQLFANIRLVFQHHIFIDNNIGWIDEIQTEIRWYKLPVVRSELLSFINAAKSWSELSLAELAKTFFNGRWHLGKNYTTERFDIEFKPLYHTPTKTDGFTVSVDITFGKLWKVQEFSSDYTSLVNFIRELSESIETL